MLVATGVGYREHLPRAAEPRWLRIYYGSATAEAVLFRDAEVAVLGGGNSAGQAAVYLSRYATRVILVTRRDPGMSQYLIDQMAAIENIEVRLNRPSPSPRRDTHPPGPRSLAPRDWRT